MLDSIPDSVDMNLSKLQQSGGQRSLAGYSLWQRAGHDLATEHNNNLLCATYHAGYHVNYSDTIPALRAFITSVQSLSHFRLCDPMNRSRPGLPVHHQLPELTQTHVH